MVFTAFYVLNFLMMLQTLIKSFFGPKANLLFCVLSNFQFLCHSSGRPLVYKLPAYLIPRAYFFWVTDMSDVNFCEHQVCRCSENDISLVLRKGEQNIMR